MTRKIFLFFLFLFCCTLPAYRVYAQVNPCTGNTPSYSLDLSGDPNGTWVSSPPVPRAGSCCGSTNPDRCVVFFITLDSSAVSINFEIIDGAVPAGSMFYQIDCGPEYPVGQPICLDGPGPYALTFCKPGNNLNTYAITSMSGPPVSPDQTVGIGCSITMSTYSLDPATITWMDITSGNGLYNSYLSCTTGCTTTIVTPYDPAPPYVDYVVCGTPATPGCMPPAPFCDTVRVFISPGILVDINPDPAIFCANFPGVELTGIVSGGDSAYTYEWTNSNGTVLSDSLTFFVIQPGTYILEVSDSSSSGCLGYDTIIVTEQQAPQVDAGNNISICETIGSVTLNGTVTNASGGIWSGGTGIFTPGNQTLNTTYIPTAAEIATGYIVLTLTSTGNGLCPGATDQIVISFTPQLSLTISGPGIVCFEDSVNLTAIISGGIPPYTYFWITGDSTQSIYAGAGTYYVSVSDGSVYSCTKNAVISITENPELVATASAQDSIQCDAIIQVTVTAYGGTGNYTYQWQNGQTSSSISVTPGTYLVTVTDAAGCTDIDTVSVNSIGTTLTATIAGSQSVCFGQIVPITAVPTGGLGFYSYLWDNGMTGSIINVSAGDHCVLITDLVGCWTTACITITENPQLNASILGYTPTCSGENIPITVYVTGGQAPYSYLWNTGQVTSGIMQPAGTYSVTVTDANSCTDTASITVFNEEPISITATSSNTSCYNGNDGSATVSVSGGVPTYYYSWSPWGGNDSTANNLTAGTYLVTVTDAMGCFEVQSVTVGEPVPVSASTIITNPSCFGGSDGYITATGLGGSGGPYTYYWSPTGDSGSVITGLSQGAYNVLVTDGLGCTGYGSAVITNPPDLSASSATSNISCTGGSNGNIIITASGGTPGYIYQWSPNVSSGAIGSNLTDGIYAITITDSFSCVYVLTVILDEIPGLTLNIINSVDVSCFGWNDGQAAVTVSGGTGPYSYSWMPSGETGADASFLAAGFNMVYVSDINGCQDSAGVTINQPPALTLSSADQNILCDSIVTLTADVSGGTPAYSYLWNTGAVTSSILSNSPGIYYISTTDARGCGLSDTVYITATNSALNTSITAPASICNGFTTTITANPSSGAGGTYFYLWSTGDTTDTSVVTGGTYCVTVTDGAGCMVTACETIVETDLLTLDITPDTICYGTTGEISAVAAGGLQPYSYLWSTGNTTLSIIGSAGVYSVTVTDSIGCTVSKTTTVSESPEMTISFIYVFDVSCQGDNNGTATATVSNGYAPFTYLWMPGSGTDSSIWDLDAGSYSVSITDSIGCVQTDTVVINEPAALLILDSVGGSNLLCFGDSNGTAVVSASGGTAPYNYLWWWNGDTIPNTSGLPEGTYNVSVADSASCYLVNSITISQPDELVIDLNNVSDVSCYDANNGEANVQVTGGTTPYTYLWSQGDTTPGITGLGPGNYGLNVTDGAGCAGAVNFTISEPNQIITATAGTISICAGQSTSISASASGGTGNYTYLWNEGLGTGAFQVVSPSVTTTYNVTVTDSNGCKDTTQSVIVFVSDPLLAFITLADDTICEGDNTTISVSANGGDGNYSYTWNDSTLGNSAGPHNVSPDVTTTYIVVIFDSCGNVPVTASVTVVVSPYPEVSITADPSEGCKILTVLFLADTANNPPGTTYLFTFDDGFISNASSVYHSYYEGGTYNVMLTATSPYGCTDTSSANGQINVYPDAEADFTAYPTTTSILNATVYFTDNSNNATSWIWSFGDGDTLFGINPQHTYSDTGLYLVALIANNGYGCPDTAWQWITIEPYYSYFIPNAFFPGSTRPNNVFIGKGQCIREFEMFIYDRWGDMIYETYDQNSPWDGRANDGKSVAQQDVYVYLINIIDCAGGEHQYLGHLTLIR